ncbi:MAG: heme-binding protein [Cyanobacteria bacterium]|nr:heme-binding protein [Cyanobacteriota bacterium]
MGYQQAYPKTPSGVIEVKQIAKAVVMEAKGSQKNYFARKRDTAPFMQLFRYIQSNNIPMTTPVEVNVEDNGMLFYAPPDAEDRGLYNTSEVTTKTLPDRTVVSIGMKGSYNQENFEKGATQLHHWLAQHPEWKASGKPYAVYWDSPYTLPFLKQSEVHLAIEQSSIHNPPS